MSQETRLAPRGLAVRRHPRGKPMNAREFLKTGDLTQAIAARAQQDVRERPLDAPNRMFVFELLCFAGQWDRATLQLDTLAELSGDSAAGDLALCRELLSAEVERERFLSCRPASQIFLR